jgi:hypothetical protein
MVSLKTENSMLQELSETTIQIASQATSCQVGGETVILDVASGKYFALDSIGTAIWNHLKSPCSIASLCQWLLTEYDVPPARCAAEVSRLVEQLACHGLVRLS